MRIKHKSFFRLKTYILSIAVISIFYIATGCSTQDSAVEEILPVAVRVHSPQLRDMSEHLTYIGSVHATNEIPVIAQVQGTVSSLPFDEGMSIKKGDLLIKLSVPDLEANVNKLKAEYNYWDQHLKEDLSLLDKNAISQEQVDISRKTFETSQASLKEVKARLRKAKEVAAFDGTILKQFVKPGQHVMPGQSLLQIGNKMLEIHVEIVQEDINKGIQVGSSVYIITNKGNKIASVISSIASAPTGSGRTFTTKLQVPSQFLNEIRIGEALTINFILNQKKQILAVPETALFSKNNEQFIYLIKDNKAIVTSVKIGIRQSGWISTEFNWNGSDLVAISNITNLSDSTIVYAVKDES